METKIIYLQKKISYLENEMKIKKQIRDEYLNDISIRAKATFAIHMIRMEVMQFQDKLYQFNL